MYRLSIPRHARIVDLLWRAGAQSGLVILIVVAVGMGYFVSRSHSPKTDHIPAIAPTNHHSNAEAWTCPMHPQIQSSNPSRCSICGMDLVRSTKDAPRGSVESEPASHRDHP